MKILVTGIEKATAKTGNEFLKVSCQTAEKKPMQLYVWDLVTEFENSFNAGNKIYECTFGGDANFPKITSFQAVNGDPTEFYDFLYQSDEFAMNVYLSLKNSVQNEFLKDLIDELMSKPFKQGTILNAFIVIPAAKAFHHEFRYGLLRHTHEVMSFVSRISDAELFKDSIDKPLVLAAALLHDVGKVYEYEFDGINTATYGTNSVVNQIYLGSHLYKGAELIALSYQTLCDKKPEYKTNETYLMTEHLKHIVMSHHLQQEWGAIPKTPKTLEAFLVFEGDYFSAAFGKFSKLDWSTVTTNDLMKETSKYDNFFGFTPLIKTLEKN